MLRSRYWVLPGITAVACLGLYLIKVDAQQNPGCTPVECYRQALERLAAAEATLRQARDEVDKKIKTSLDTQDTRITKLENSLKKDSELLHKIDNKLSQANALYLETGAVKTDRLPSSSDAPFPVRVNFKKQFLSPPEVITSIKDISSTGATTTLRTRVVTVDRCGFDMVFEKLSNNEINSGTQATWLAFGWPGDSGC